MPDLKGKTAIVTGGGQGIGRGIALAFAEAHARIVLMGRTLATLEAVCAEINGLGSEALAVSGDVRVLADIRHCLARAENTFGGLDILVNNAQTTHHAFLLDSSDDDMEDTFRSGPMATFRFMREAHPLLSRRGGVIINVGSSSTLMYDGAFYGTYSAAKAGIEALTRTAAVEWGKDGIRAVLILPSAETPMVTQMKSRDVERYREMVSRTPLGRFGDPLADIGRAVAWLASDDASFITGSAVMLDGGQMFMR
jgi:NAD(P)-dependent dehydrogenase (short-subunit alcohol dehydrogenase family)